MNWEGWVNSKKRNLIAVIFFIIAYVLTIPIRDYGFLDSVIDTTQGVSISTHLALIIVGSVVLIILLEIILIIIRRSLNKKF